MKVHLIKKNTIKNYILENAISKSAFNDWIAKIESADWEKPTDIQGTFNSADILGESSSRIVFNIGGNNYRLICKFFFGDEQVHLFICWIGKHAEYDLLCRSGKQYTVRDY